jgi:hypothetical protein
VSTAGSTSTLELLAWVDGGERTYAETMAAWTSNCPRHPAWDDAITDGLVQVVGGRVALSARGRAILDGTNNEVQ